jgi:3(or 17)beta-hydroxysteroid dehydrogenase
MGRLEGKAALVTGGASGLGKAIAERLASDGAAVVVTDVQLEMGQQTAAEHGFTFLQQDVCDEARWAEVVRGVEERCGSLDVLVNNAGIVGPLDAVNPENTRLADLQQIFAVNVEGVFLGCRAALPAMRRAGGGSIINISSVAGLLATPYATAYGASKAAVRQLTKSVAQHCAQERNNIRCNSVHPGNVRTPLWERIAAELASARGLSAADIMSEAEARIPLGSFTDPEDIAAVVSFLASKEARQVTGAKFIVDGGIVNCDTYGRMDSTSMATNRESGVSRQENS